GLVQILEQVLFRDDAAGLRRPLAQLRLKFLGFALGLEQLLLGLGKLEVFQLEFLRERLVHVVADLLGLEFRTFFSQSRGLLVLGGEGGLELLHLCFDPSLLIGLRLFGPAPLLLPGFGLRLLYGLLRLGEGLASLLKLALVLVALPFEFFGLS